MRRYRLHLSVSQPLLVITPAHLTLTLRERYHGDAIVHRTNKRTKVAPHTILLAHLGNRFAWNAARAETLAVGIDQIDALMRAILASDVAQIAADAFIVINAGHAFVVEVERFPFLQRRHRLAGELGDAFESFGIKIIVKTLDHIFHDAEAIMHYRGAHLHADRAEGDELGSVAPVANASYARDRKRNIGIGRATLHHVQSNRLHRWP